jgi:hypothetical protein
MSGLARYTVLLLLGFVGCGEAAPEFSDDEILAVFQELHTAIYDVYGVEFDRDAVYDLLAASFAGDELTREYVEHYTTKWRMQHDDTKVTILRVDYADTLVSRRIGEGAVVEADWNVGGVVYHQGHSHARINRYRAAYTLQPRAQGFRIVDTKMKDMERVRLDMMSGGSLGLDEPLPTSGQGMLSPSDLLKAGMVPVEPTPAADGEETP